MTDNMISPLSGLFSTPDIRSLVVMKSVEEVTKTYHSVMAMNDRAAQDLFDGEDRVEKLEKAGYDVFERHLHNAAAFLTGLGISHRVDVAKIKGDHERSAAFGTLRAKYSEWRMTQAGTVADKILDLIQKLQDAAK